MHDIRLVWALTKVVDVRKAQRVDNLKKRKKLWRQNAIKSRDSEIVKRQKKKEKLM